MERTTALPPVEMSGLGRPLRVVQVVRQYTPSRGGLEDVVSNLSRSLSRRGFEVRVVTLDRLFRAPDQVLPTREVIDGIEVVRIPWRGSSRYPIAPQVFRLIGDADLVHVHGIDFFYDALAWTRPFHRKPMIGTTHGGCFHTRNHAALK
jgi:alpha-1,3-mannosyltransferase